MKIAAISDIHYPDSNPEVLRPVFAEIAKEADALLIAGDLTQHGLVTEINSFIDVVKGFPIPIVTVLGNHDVEGGEENQLITELEKASIKVLNGDSFLLDEVAIIGTKGFGGGFGQNQLTAWGESTIKVFVAEAVNETLKIENALTRITAKKKIVLLHYSPIEATVVGEAKEIYPFLGCSRLSEPLDRFNVDFVFHGHAHHGKESGKSQGGVMVYNVSYPLLATLYPKKPYQIITVRV